MSTITGPDDPKLDHRIDFNGTIAELRAQFPASTIPLGVVSTTTDRGFVVTANVNGVVDWWGFAYAPI